jgi:very-short-patch-repair endonuclease
MREEAVAATDFKNEHRHFRRQVPINKYIADLACHYCKLVVELTVAIQ